MGVDNIPAEVLKYAGRQLREYLLVFFNSILKSGNVPPALNVVKCILLHKGGDSLNLLNYRPLAISSSLLRILTQRMAQDMSSISEAEGYLGKPHINVYFPQFVCFTR